MSFMILGFAYRVLGLVFFGLGFKIRVLLFQCLVFILFFGFRFCLCGVAFWCFVFEVMVLEFVFTYWDFMLRVCFVKLMVLVFRVLVIVV